MYTNRCSLAGCKKKEVNILWHDDFIIVPFEECCYDVYCLFLVGSCEVQYLPKELLYKAQAWDWP